MSGVEESFLTKVTIDWLIQYAKVLRFSSKTMEQMKKCPERYELVPVPVEIIRQWTIYDTIGVSAWIPEFYELPPDIWLPYPPPPPPWWFYKQEVKASVEDLEIAKHFEPLADLVRRFGRAFEKGDLEGTMQFIADDYRDHDGRTKKDLEKSLSDLFKKSSERRMIFVNAEDMVVVGNKIVASVNGAWEAKVKEESGSSLKSEFFKVEYVFSQDAKGKWSISSIKQR